LCQSRFGWHHGGYPLPEAVVTRFLISVFFLLCMTPWPVAAATPQLWGGLLSAGNSYSPNGEVQWLDAAVTLLYDYDDVWPYPRPAPDPLRFKLEGHINLAEVNGVCFSSAVNMLALWEWKQLQLLPVTPYFEAGIGVIYTDFRLRKQGLRWNFNPVFGFGFFKRDAADRRWFAALRFHHISNAGLDEDNRGVNSAFLQIGCFFKP